MEEVEIPVYEWPDGTWCLQEDLEEYLNFQSDDYKVVEFDPQFHV